MTMRCPVSETQRAIALSSLPSGFSSSSYSSSVRPVLPLIIAPYAAIFWHGAHENGTPVATHESDAHEDAGIGAKQVAADRGDRGASAAEACAFHSFAAEARRARHCAH